MRGRVCVPFRRQGHAESTPDTRQDFMGGSTCLLGMTKSGGANRCTTRSAPAGRQMRLPYRRGRAACIWTRSLLHDRAPAGFRARPRPAKKSLYIASDILWIMSEWFQRVGSSIPRGFSRYFILEVLQESPCTGKEIIDHATRKSEGDWKPSPGLIYPLLGRLLDEGMVEETGGGKYGITEKGKATAQDVGKIHEAVRKQLDVLARVGNAGRFVAMDLLERITVMGTMLSANASNMTDQEVRGYRKFLETELEKVCGRPPKGGKEIKIE
ncbi:transcriptional regulator [Cenarchaeum symbiosum A]|uniref:Transcriptional regulator n=1 Tax=Cenarchaeum symbiosum (strain A) TaxID=414004 RepID=A0RYA5_CENSY|nr:transcriptional regulator [Cenarchaeum symbiosum A]